MNELLLDCLAIVARELAKEAKTKKEWGHFGNSCGVSESKKFLLAASGMLRTIAEAID